MSDITTISLGILAAAIAGSPVFASEGDHTLTATVTGAGAVSATVAWQGSNDGVGWITIATLIPSGTAVGAAQASTTSSYRYWRQLVSALTGSQVSSVVATETGGQAASVSNAGKSSLTGGLSMFNHVNNSPTDGFSVHMQWPTFGKFYGSRIGIINKRTGAMQLTRAQGGTSAVSGANANTITNWDPYLWAGVANPLFAAASQPGTANDVFNALNLSDWNYNVKSKDRTDDPAKRPVLQIVVSASANFSASGAGASTFADILAATGLEFLSRVATSDIATAPGAANSAPTVAGTWVAPAYVEPLYELPTTSIMDFGDSRNRGQIGSSATNGWGSTAWRVAMLRNARTSLRITTPNSFSVSGQKHTSSFETLKLYVPQTRPRIVITQVHSANDPLTQAQIDQDWQEISQTQSLCLQYGILHIVLTCPAYGRPDNEDVFRRTLNNRLRNSGLVFADIAAAADDPLVPYQLKASFNGGDSLHGTELYYATQADLVDAIAAPYI